MNTKSTSTLKLLENELRFKNYSKNTIKIYVHYAKIFLSHFDKDIYHISQKEAVEHIKSIDFNSISYQNQYISTIKSLYKYIVKCQLCNFILERPRKEKHLPQVIDKSFLLDRISKIQNIKHKAIISIAYSVGLINLLYNINYFVYIYN